MMTEELNNAINEWKIKIKDFENYTNEEIYNGMNEMFNILLDVKEYLNALGININKITKHTDINKKIRNAKRYNKMINRRNKNV